MERSVGSVMMRSTERRMRRSHFAARDVVLSARGARVSRHAAAQVIEPVRFAERRIAASRRLHGLARARPVLYICRSLTCAGVEHRKRVWTGHEYIKSTSGSSNPTSRSRYVWHDFGSARRLRHGTAVASRIGPTAGLRSGTGRPADGDRATDGASRHRRWDSSSRRRRATSATGRAAGVDAASSF